MLKAELVERLNTQLIDIQKRYRPLFAGGTEDDCLYQIELARQTYSLFKELGVEAAKKRNLKNLKEYGDSQVRKERTLIEPHSPRSKKKSKKPQTKDERLSAALQGLGISPEEFANRMKGGVTK